MTDQPLLTNPSFWLGLFGPLQGCQASSAKKTCGLYHESSLKMHWCISVEDEDQNDAIFQNHPKKAIKKNILSDSCSSPLFPSSKKITTAMLFVCFCWLCWWFFLDCLKTNLHRPAKGLMWASSWSHSFRGWVASRFGVQVISKKWMEISQWNRNTPWNLTSHSFSQWKKMYKTNKKSQAFRRFFPWPFSSPPAPQSFSSAVASCLVPPIDWRKSMQPGFFSGKST